jgi:uncharacterized hydrophobic protein (TIGR00271 family)
MALAAIIAAVGLLTDSVVLIIAAMIVGPDFGPLAGTSVAIATRHWAALGRSLAALLVGFALAVVVAWVSPRSRGRPSRRPVTRGSRSSPSSSPTQVAGRSWLRLRPASPESSR